MHCPRGVQFFGAVALFLLAGTGQAQAQTANFQFNDSHLHLTNNVQEGPAISDFLNMMGNKAGRVALFGIPLQQQWSYRIDGDRKPTYYLHSDAPLYYYSFTDAWIAMAYKSLTKEQQARLDPMITGFNPTDMYAADHIRRVLEAFPGVFTGIGEFTIHKEFVSAKIPGEVASLQDPSLDRILDFAGEVGLVVLIHSDIDIPFAKEGSEPAYINQMRALFKRHPNVTIIWAHMGLGRTVHPSKNHFADIEAILRDPDFNHVYFDISWDEVAKYFIASPEATRITADLMRRYPDRFLFGTDSAAPANESQYTKVFLQYEPLWHSLDADTSRKVRLQNYERIFDEARRNVRHWEAAHAAGPGFELNGRLHSSNSPVPSCALGHKRIPLQIGPPRYNYRLDLSTPLVNPSKSNRRYPRIPTPKGVWVSWQHDGAQSVSRVRDLNIGGLFIENTTPPPVGTSITLLFSVPEGEIRSSAIVRNVMPGEGMGVQFIAMSQEHAVRLQTLFTRLLRSSNPTPA